MMSWYSLSSLCLDAYWSLDVVDTLSTPTVRMYLSLFECVSDGQLRHTIVYRGPSFSKSSFIIANAIGPNVADAWQPLLGLISSRRPEKSGQGFA